MSHADTHDPEEEFVATGEDNVEDVEVEEAEISSTETQKKLRAKLKACEEEKRQHLEEIQRSKADFLNSKRRLEEDRIAQVARATRAHLADLFPLADSFAMAMKNEEAWKAVDATWRSGIEGIHNQLQAIFKKNNIETLNPEGETFDPARHEAVGTTDSETPSETIIEVVQVGYTQNGELVRPAKVIISN